MFFGLRQPLAIVLIRRCIRYAFYAISGCFESRKRWIVTQSWPELVLCFGQFYLHLVIQDPLKDFLVIDRHTMRSFTQFIRYVRTCLVSVLFNRGQMGRVHSD
jgi:hypothetical protein